MRIALALSLSLSLAGCGFSVAGGSDDAGPGRDGGGDAAADGIDAPPDAAPDAPPDAFVFTPSLCPPAYDRTIGAAPGSRYRVISTGAPFATHHADCTDDHAGWTHLVAFDTQPEAAAVGGLMSGFFYVGLVQAPNQAAINLSWFRITGEPIATGWSSANPVQPEDGNEYVENNEENLAVAGTNGLYFDVRGLSSYAAVCECDGHAVDAAVAALIP